MYADACFDMSADVLLLGNRPGRRLSGPVVVTHNGDRVMCESEQSCMRVCRSALAVTAACDALMLVLVFATTPTAQYVAMLHLSWHAAA